MAFIKIIIFWFLLPSVCSAFFKLEKDENGLIKWNDLRVTWGRNVTDKHFVQLPRTVGEAREQGFVKQSDCDANAKWRGVRYMQEDDPYVLLLFDVKGFIAGIQTRVPKEDNATFPSAFLMPPFEKDGDMYILSVYFVNPAIICSTGRTEEDFSKEGTGTKLYIQFGSNPETDFLMGPRSQNGTVDTLWQKGGFIRTMGLHFWYNLSQGMKCDELVPYFLMYHENQLTGFGFGFPISHPSRRFEHPPTRVLGTSMGIVPTCVRNLKSMSSMHVFLTDIGPQTSAGYSTYLKAGYRLQVISCVLTLLMTFAVSFSF